MVAVRGISTSTAYLRAVCCFKFHCLSWAQETCERARQPACVNAAFVWRQALQECESAAAGFRVVSTHLGGHSVLQDELPLQQLEVAAELPELDFTARRLDQGQGRLRVQVHVHHTLVPDLRDKPLCTSSRVLAAGKTDAEIDPLA